MPSSTDSFTWSDGYYGSGSGSYRISGDGILRNAIAALGLPSDTVLQAKYEGATTRFGIVWTDLDAQPSVQECRLRVCFGNHVPLDLSLGQQKFPPRPTGGFWCMWPTQYSRAEIRVTLDFETMQALPRERPAAWDLIAAGESLVPMHGA